MKSFYVHNGSVRLHVLEKGKASKGGTSLLIVGGIWESAERAIPLLNGLSGHVVSFSFRGRGLISTPETGYTLADHHSGHMIPDEEREKYIEELQLVLNN